MRDFGMDNARAIGIANVLIMVDSFHSNCNYNRNCNANLYTTKAKNGGPAAQRPVHKSEAAHGTAAPQQSKALGWRWARPIKTNA